MNKRRLLAYRFRFPLTRAVADMFYFQFHSLLQTLGKDGEDKVLFVRTDR
jgi:hypothetical protein